MKHFTDTYQTLPRLCVNDLKILSIYICYEMYKIFGLKLQEYQSKHKNTV